MKKNIFYLFAHQDDEFGTFIKLEEDFKKNNTFVFYLTSGEDNMIKKKDNSKRDMESLNALQKLGGKKKNIFFLGSKYMIQHNKLYLDIDYIYKKILAISSSIGKPNSIITHSWEGGHEDHDACNLIGRKIAKKFKIMKESHQFSLYNSYNTSLLYFKVFNPIIKYEGEKVFSELKKRIFYIKLLFIYKSQIKTWIGLYPFVIFHYLFKGYNFIERLNCDNFIKKPHLNGLLYEKRKFCTFEKFKSKTKFFLNDIK
jgi:LmbE family N-acetylglucosaminyl deacetylase